jgi:2-haloacid dehalogenase
MGRTVIAFDLYGTILSTGSISAELAKIYGEDKAQLIAPLARRYQLESTWRANSMGKSRHSLVMVVANVSSRRLSLIQ